MKTRLRSLLELQMLQIGRQRLHTWKTLLVQWKLSEYCVFSLLKSRRSVVGITWTRQSFSKLRLKCLILTSLFPISSLIESCDPESVAPEMMLNFVDIFSIKLISTLYNINIKLLVLKYWTRSIDCIGKTNINFSLMDGYLTLIVHLKAWINNFNQRVNGYSPHWIYPYWSWITITNYDIGIISIIDSTALLIILVLVSPPSPLGSLSFSFV